MRYCEALTTATGYGFWIFPPIDLRLLFDGEQVWWSYGDDETWLPLSATASKAVQFPGFSAAFDSIAPEHLAGCSPPFISAMPETGGVQIWTGLLAKTAPGWSLAVRPPINLPVIPGLATWEGVIETDIWFGPLFSNFQITKTDMPVYLRADVPFLQVQPLPQIAYSDETHASCLMGHSEDLTETDWDKLSEVLLPSADQEARQGSYAVAVRKRRLIG
jgi:hypothetical protein